MVQAAIRRVAAAVPWDRASGKATRRADPNDATERSADNGALLQPDIRPVGIPCYGSYPFGGLQCRIYRPAPSVKQAGGANGRG
jgi:hypothetical protein